MSLSTALNSAVSGLMATSRATELVSENLANVGTEGYARRSLEVSSLVNGGRGVRVVAVQREVDPALIAARRAAEAEQIAAQGGADLQSRLQALVGLPGSGGSLSDRLSTLETALISAASRPESGQRLDAAVAAASDLVQGLNRASRGVADIRRDADAAIDRQVGRLNAALEELRGLNQRITAVASSGAPSEGLLDQRQLLVDEINRAIPVHVVARPHNQIALYTKGGAALLDGRAASLSFTPANLVTADMSVASGALSGLSLNGIAIRTDPGSPHLGGGSLAAGFRIRDVDAPRFQAEIDEVAADLVRRFEATGLDASLAAGAPGLFTDAGTAHDPLTQVGIAGRLALNRAVDPAQGGATWRLRDGLGAAMPGPPGDARLLQAFGAALDQPLTQPGGVLGTGQTTAAGLLNALTSAVGQRRDMAEQTLSRANAIQAEMIRAERAKGVDTDQELQSLISLERAYGANAKVIEVVDDMMQRLLRI